MRPIVLMLFALCIPTAAPAFDVTACGQTVPAGAVGRLVAVFESLTASGNRLVGLRCDRCQPRLKSSTLMGNDVDEIGIDLQSRGKPRLIRSSCGKSLGLGTGP